jgi:hypothetical protein
MTTTCSNFAKRSACGFKAARSSRRAGRLSSGSVPSAFQRRILSSATVVRPSSRSKAERGRPALPTLISSASSITWL